MAVMFVIACVTLIGSLATVAWMGRKRPVKELPPMAAPEVVSTRELPYRSAAEHEPPTPPPPNPDDELARLAERGQRRAHDETSKQETERKQKREWVRLHRLCDAMRLLPDAPPTMAQEAVPAEVEFPPADMVDESDVSYPEPPQTEVVAAARKAHHESAWLASLPFALDGYLRTLGLPASTGTFSRQDYCLSISVVLADPTGAPTREIVEGVVHAYDVRAVVTMSSDAIVIQSGGLPVWSDGHGYSIERIAPYVHGLMNSVLLPLHRSRSITRVTFERIES